MNIFTFNDDFGGHRSLFCESADVVGEDGEQFVRLEDHLASHAFDEEKERALFIEQFKLDGKIYFDANTKQWLPTRDSIEGFRMAERTLGCWVGWSACAKSRSNQ